MEFWKITLWILFGICYAYFVFQTAIYTIRFRKSLQMQLLLANLKTAIQGYIDAKNKESQRFFLGFLNDLNNRIGEIFSYSKFRLWLYRMDTKSYLEEIRETHSDISKFIEQETEDLNKSWSIRNGRR